MERYAGGIERSMQALQEAEYQRNRFSPVEGWSAKERSKEARDKRVEKAKADFWYFDRTYFPPSMYKDGYAEPAAFHKHIVKIMQQPGFHVLLGPRKHGKTVTAKKVLLWLYLSGRLEVAGTYSEDLDVARILMDSIAWFLENNLRIREDWDVEVLVQNKDELRFTTSEQNYQMVCYPFSEDRSVKGYGEGFLRPQVILGDDAETRTSSLDSEVVRKRVNKWDEAFQSLGDDGIFIQLGNNFDPSCAYNQLLKQHELGLLPDYYHVHVFKAWNGRPLWKQRYPAESEAELKVMLKVRDEFIWLGDFQQQPTPPDGIVFQRVHYREYRVLPKDVVSVIYTDQNLALKSKGDTTAIVRLSFSPSTNLFYVAARCKSYDNPNTLLDDIIEIIHKSVRAIAFDGHVNQQSHWVWHIRSWQKEHKRPFPHHEFREYTVDELSGNAQIVYSNNRILFPEGFILSEEGGRFMAQMFGFVTKKQSRKDDAPDALICALQFATDRRMVRAHTPADTQVSIISDHYSL